MSLENSDAIPHESLIPMHCLGAANKPLGSPFLAKLRTGTPVWVVQRHEDVRQVLTDPRLNRANLFAPDAPALTPYPNLLDSPDILINLDGLEHRRLRRTVSRAFTPRAIARWRPWVSSVVDDLIDQLAEQHRPVDLVAGFVRSLPVAVFSRLMGLDSLDRKRLAYWSDHAFATTAFPSQQVQEAMADFVAFGAALVAQRRADPGEDLVSSLIEAALDDGEVTEEQIISLTVLLVVAGHEVTTTVLGNALLYLLTEGRDTWRELGMDESLAPAATDQLLRGISISDRDVLPGFMRRAVEDVEVGGVLIRAGSLVAADTATANLDPDVYPEDWRAHPFSSPDTPHLAFGAGPHYCLGSWLARMEMELALHRLPKRLPGLRLAVAPHEIDWRRGLLTRSPQTLLASW
ncbi:cytochrome P450 [Streptomyces sp. TRM72054]|uniref:cytochrome P450 n=1 Tax=Streptomyces sp. TRM72054 TaxID=2870562 RepID=UPI0021AB8189|nr:cytochrome P450 [Streptomyces sp. TRM72054]